MQNRLARGGYWLRWLIALAISLAAAFLARLDGGIIVAIFELIVSLAVSIYMIVMGVRRMHDVDKSGWFILVPIYNLILTLTDGTPGSNRFGDDPRGRGRGAEETSVTWSCPACGARNTSFDKEKCFACGAPRPAGDPPAP